MTADQTTPSQISGRVIANARRLRKVRGWSGEELARRLTEAGYPTSAVIIYNRESRSRQTTNITANELFALADVFGCSVTELAEDVPRCDGAPPTGYQCPTCGAAGNVVRGR